MVQRRPDYRSRRRRAYLQPVSSLVSTAPGCQCRGAGEVYDAQPTPMQKFFLTHKEINIAEFARSIGMNATLLRNYINGFKKPSVEREKAILAHIHQLGQELMAANF